MALRSEPRSPRLDPVLCPLLSGFRGSGARAVVEGLAKGLDGLLTSLSGLVVRVSEVQSKGLQKASTGLHEACKGLVGFGG